MDIVEYPVADIDAEDPREYAHYTEDWEEKQVEYETHGGPAGYIDYLMDWIGEEGLQQPVRIYRCGQLADGHHRLHAVKRLGWKTIPAVVLDESYQDVIDRVLRDSA